MQLASFTLISDMELPTKHTTDRYEKGLHLFDGRYTFLPSYKKRVVTESPLDVFHELTAGEVGKLDLVSYKYYGTPYLWWVIALANKILNPLTVQAGTRLRVPALDEVYRGVL